MYVRTYACMRACVYVCVRAYVGLHIIEIREKVHLNTQCYTVAIHYATQKHFIPR
jgi:hypothetical protein